MQPSPWTTEQARAVSPLTLAYIGDAVYETFVRTQLVQAFPQATSYQLHRRAAKVVCAAGQAGTAQKLKPLLTEQEQDVFRRGRNTHPATVPKHASVTDYREATALEALFGYLYMTHQQQRLTELMEFAKTHAWGKEQDE